MKFNFGADEFAFNPANAVTELTKRGELSESRSKSGAGAKDADADEKDAPIFATRGVGSSRDAADGKEPRKATKSFFAGAPVVLSPEIRTLKKQKTTWYTLVDYPLSALAGVPGRVIKGAKGAGGVSVEFFLPDVGRCITLNVPPELLLGATKSELDALTDPSRGPVSTLPGAALETGALLRDAVTAGAALEAKRAVAAVLRSWPADLSMTELGDDAAVIKTLKHLFAMEYNEAQVSGTPAPVGAGSLRDTLSKLLAVERESGASHLVDSLVQDCFSAIAEEGGKGPSRRKRGGGVPDTVLICESPHDYFPNSNEKHAFSIPGASQLEITFDPRCKTEENYDCLFFTDESYSEKHAKYTGDPPKWPKEPVIVDGDTLYTLFTSDGSGQYWGYRLEIRAVGMKSSGGDSLISDADILKPRPEWGFWLVDFMLAAAAECGDDSVYSDQIIAALIGFVMAPGKSVPLRKECVTLLRRVLDGVTSRKIVSAATSVKEQLPALGVRLSKLAGDPGSRIWRRPFAQACVELMAAAQSAVSTLPRGGGAGNAGAEESKGNEMERESKDDGAAAVAPTWTSEKKADHMEVSEDGAVVTNTFKGDGEDSDDETENNKIHMGSEWYSSGVHRFTISTEPLAMAGMTFFGVASRAVFAGSWDSDGIEEAMDSGFAGVISAAMAFGDDKWATLKWGGAESSDFESSASLTEGLRMEVELDMDNRMLNFNIGGQSHTISDLPAEDLALYVATCPGLTVRLQGVSAASAPRGPVTVPIRWTTEKKGPRVELEDDNKTLRITGSEEGSTQAADQWYSSGVHTIKLRVDEVGEMPVGIWGVAGRNIMDADWDEPVIECESAIGLCLGPGGEGMSFMRRDHSPATSTFPQLSNGAIVTAEIDMEQRTLKISINDSGPETYRDLPPEVCFAVSSVAGAKWVLEEQVSNMPGSSMGGGGGNTASIASTPIERLASTLASATRALRLLSDRTPEASATLAVEMRTAVQQQFDSHAPLQVTSGEGSFTLGSDGTLKANSSFPSLKASGVELKKGKWYYEMQLIETGLVQIGWADGEYRGDASRGQGVGDDSHSWAYDGSRTVKFHGGSSGYGKSWSKGDVVGCAVDLDSGVCSFSLNGDFEDPMGLAFSDMSPSRFLTPAVSLNSGPTVRLLFRRSDFSFAPPDESYRSVAESLDQTTVSPTEVAEELGEAVWTPEEDAALVTHLNHAAYKGHCRVSDLKLQTVIKSGKHAVRQRVRAALIREVNSLWRKALPLVNFMAYDDLARRGMEASAAGSLVAELLDSRGLLFTSTKQELWDLALSASSGSSSGERGIVINRSRAIDAAKATAPDESTVRATQFGQTHEQLSSTAPSQWRHKDRAWKVNYEGEEGIDAGGLYNAHTSALCTEIMEGSVWFFMPTPNGSNHTGSDRDRYMLRPSANQTWVLSMLEFLGRLMGVALRRQRPLNLSLSSIFWRRLVGQDVTLHDLKSCDFALWRQLNDLGTTGDDMTEEDFTAAIGERMFTAQDSEGRVVPLIPGGADTPLTLADRDRYVEAALRMRGAESDAQVAAVRRGLTAIVPGHLLRMYAAEELEYMVCGLPTVDVDLLKRTTEYSGCSKDDRFIQYFWEVMEHDFSDADRVGFLSFVWGCSRLPNSESLLRPENCHLKISVQGVSGNPDNYYAIAHTCFFQVELPRYSSREVMADKLRESILVGSKSGFMIG